VAKRGNAGALALFALMFTWDPAARVFKGQGSAKLAFWLVLGSSLAVSSRVSIDELAGLIAGTPTRWWRLLCC